MLAGGLLALACAHQRPGPIADSPPRISAADETGRHAVTLRHRPTRPASRVCVAGDFNGWDPGELPMTDADADGVHEITLMLEPGRVCYKFVLDGAEWTHDPLNPAREPGGYENSILYVGVDPADFPEDREPPAPPRPAYWLPEREQREPTPRSEAGGGSLFRLADNGYDSVSVSGDFNGWTGQLDQLVFDPASREWRLMLDLEAHPFFQYRFVVTRDGGATSLRDPLNPNITFDGHPIDSVGFHRRDPEFAGPRGVVQIAAENLTASTSTCEARPIYVWLPPGYADSPGRRFPVVYMHDGQNAFDDPVNPFGHGGWHTNVTAAALIASSEIEPFLIVAIPNTGERMAEYGLGENVFDASAHPYARYLIDDVMPLINRRYRTWTGPEHTSLMGSSMGGLISLFLAYHHPGLFGQAACLSTAFSIPDTRGRLIADLISAEGHRPVRVYLDSGTGGPMEDGAPGTRAVRDLMLARGWTLDQDLVWHEEPGAPHNETAWRERVWRPLTFLTGRRP